MAPMADNPPVYTLADTWHLNNRVNLTLVDHLSEEQLAVTPNPRARSIADQLAHLHNVRMMWLEPVAPAAAQGLSKLEKGSAAKQAVKEALGKTAQPELSDFPVSAAFP